MVYFAQDILELISNYLDIIDLPNISGVSSEWYKYLHNAIERRKSIKYYNNIRYYNNGYTDNLYVQLINISDMYGIAFHKIEISPNIYVIANDQRIIGYRNKGIIWNDDIDLSFLEQYIDYSPGGCIYMNHTYITMLARMGIWNDDIRLLTKHTKSSNNMIMEGVNDYVVLDDGTILSEYRGTVQFSVGTCHVEILGDVLYYQTPIDNIIVGCDYIYVEDELPKVIVTMPGSYEFRNITVTYGIDKECCYIIDISSMQ